MKKPSPEQVKEVLYAAAEDLGKAGIDIQTGHGRATTDFLDVGRIIPDDEYDDYHERDAAGCRTGLAIVVIGALLWIAFITALII